HHYDHDEHCCCGEHEHHHHHDHDEHCCCGEHEHHHHHDHDEHCCCGDHEHHHHHHHADEVFTSWGVETAKKFTIADIEDALNRLETQEYGFVLRAKGIVPSNDGNWIHFDYVPGEINIRNGGAAVTGKLCVIGADLDEAAIAQVFGV
ncbi:MAG: GTP-binding protein, partial [Oscillospiraceae bacterium]|nr:GTP-binding protein [Oscillospiraceae bacterium]